MTKIILNHYEIEQRLPHSGNMSLLNEIIQFDKQSLTALAISHLDASNPLWQHGRINTVNGIEYAAQAMAVHGSLLINRELSEKLSENLSEQSSKTPLTGYIATVRNIIIKVPQLPAEKTPLRIEVVQLMSNEDGFTYQFHISCEQQSLISGRITVFLMQT